MAQLSKPLSGDRSVDDGRRHRGHPRAIATRAPRIDTLTDDTHHFSHYTLCVR